MKFKLILIAIVLLNVGLSQAQVTTTEPKVGLVLSGGGAKGFAHIGTLKVIDSLGIKVDYIAGTSMGAIIGSLYASGYSAKQLDSLFRTIDFDAVINDQFSRASKSFYERSNFEKYALSLPFNDFKISLPSGISRGQNVYSLLYKMMMPVSEINNFSELPIPFFCMATNVETGEALQMEEGILAEAVLASGAFPSLFRPVTIEDQILIDGGVTNNYPIEELKAKGMDVIIGVDVQDELRKREKLNSAPEILVQINNYRTINDMKRKRELTDIYIKPDISDFSVISFSEGRDIIENGEQAAMLQLNALSELRAKQTGVVDRPLLKIPEELTISTVYFEGNQRYTRSYMLGKLKLKGENTLSYDKLSQGISNLVATNNFDAFRYRLKKQEDGTYRMNAQVTESKDRTFLRMGLHYDNLYKAAAIVNVSSKGLLFKNDLASLDVILGDNSRYNFDYFIDKGFYISIGLKSRYSQFNRNINAQLILPEDDPRLNDINKIEAELRDQTNQFYLQTLFQKDFALSVGAEHKRLKIKSETLLDPSQEGGITFENTDYLSLFGGLKLDTYDNRYFPNNGVSFNGDLHWYLSASHFNENFNRFAIAKADIGYAFSFGKSLSFLAESSGGFQIDEGGTNFLDFAIGGYANNFINNFGSFYGYDFISLTGNSFVKATLTADYELFKKHHILASANFANIEDDIFTTGEWLSTPDYSGYAIGYSVETFFGPVEAKYTWSPENNSGFWFFNVGYWF
ncbi:patatin-like phospholipase family protein [Winogradskyella maritima]|uniref:Patatin-like phospholipase family protein n=1 Tax=Winogradskyella maritima TaxID=1517766 RepID=A0ABV8AE62_9FLAO|nr:patatin-like phospholipase family protein [Winogradskyella maritima]